MSKPTVANADMQVNRISRNVKDSFLTNVLVVLSSIAIKRTKSKEPTVIPTAFRITLSEINLLPIITSFWPLKVDLVAAIKAINVVVFMPPPVPPVLAPINMSVINNKRPVSEIEFKEIGWFVKPAVLALTVSKIDDNNLSNKFKSSKNWLFNNDSVIKNPNDPIKI